MSKAIVTPHQHWPFNGIADVTPSDNPKIKVILPVEKRSQGVYTIRKADYPRGVVLVDPQFAPTPPDSTCEMEYRTTDGPEETCGPGWADGGVVILFHD